MYFEHQKENEKLLMETFKKNNYIVISGDSKSGKEYVTQEFDFNGIKLFVKNNSKSQTSEISNAILDNEQFKKTKLGLYFSFGVSFYHLCFSLSIKKTKLDDPKKFILRLFYSMLKKHNILLVIKNYKDLDLESRKTIEVLINKDYTKYKNKLFVAFIENENKCIDIGCEPSLKKIHFKNFHNYSENAEKRKDDFTKSVSILLRNNITLTEKEMEFLFKNFGNSIDNLLELLDAINGSKLIIDNDNSRDDNNLLINLILNNLKDKLFSGDQLLELFSYLSLIEGHAKASDLAYLLNRLAKEVHSSLSKGKENKVILDKNQYWKYSFSLLQKLFQEQSYPGRFKIYNNLMSYYSKLYPTHYKEIANYAELCNTANHKLYYVQYVLQKIRIGVNLVGENDINSHLCENTYIEFINKYQEAFTYARENENQKSIEILEQIQIDGILKIERDIILSQNKIKMLDEESRTEGLKLLENIPLGIIKDNFLKFRVNLRKISTLVHIGEYRKAKQAYDICDADLCCSIDLINSERQGLDYYGELSSFLGVLYRKANCVYDSNFAIIKMEKATLLFKDLLENDTDYLCSYYISLVNYFAILILNNKFDEAEKQLELIENLKIKNFVINFPRQYILKNNRLLLDYFSNKKDKAKVLEEFNIIYRTLPISAEKLLIGSNYSIFLAINGRVSEAKAILDIEEAQINTDLEGLYNYRIVTNGAIYDYLLGKDKAAILDKLNKITIDDNSACSKFLIKRHRKIINLIEADSPRDVDSWIATMEQNITRSSDPQNYYDRAFIYTTSFNWDDD